MDVLNIRLGRIFNNVKIKGYTFFSCIKNKKKYLFFAVVLAVVAFGLIFPNNNVHADAWNGDSSSWSWGESLSGLVLEIVAPVIYIIFYVIMWIGYAVAWVGVDVINITLSPLVMNQVLDISTGSSLYQAWSIFRDIANLLFILILLLVAFGTIFQSGDYNIKKSLPKLILVAFLINFSAMITGVIIDFTNILMFGIVKMMCTGNPSSCTQDFMKPLWEGVINPIFDRYSMAQGFLFGGFKSAAQIAIAAIYMLIFGLVLIALGIFFLIRIAAFAILIVLSPLAFFGEVVSSLNSISKKWWDNLWEYAFFGPIAVLLLYVSGIMMQNTINVDMSVFTSNPNMSWLQTDISMIISQIIPLIFLFAIIPITRSMGIAGANAVMGTVVTGGAAFAGDVANRWLARGAGVNRGFNKDGSKQTGIKGWLNRGYSKARHISAYASPGAIKRAYKAQTANQEHDYDVARAKIQDRLGWKRPGVVSEAKNVAEAEAHRQLGEMNIKNTDEMVTKLSLAIADGNAGLIAEIMRSLAVNGDINDALDRLSRNHDHTAADFNQFMNDNIKPLLGEEDTAKLSGEIGKAEEKNGTYIYTGHNKYDKENDKYEMLDMNNDDKKRNRTKEDATAMQIKTMLGRWEAKPERQRMNNLSKHSVVDKDDTITRQGAALMALTKGQEAQKKVTGMKPKTAKAIYAGMSKENAKQNPEDRIFADPILSHVIIENKDEKIEGLDLKKVIGGNSEEIEKIANNINKKIEDNFIKEKVEKPRTGGNERRRQRTRQVDLEGNEVEEEEEAAATEEEESQ